MSAALSACVIDASVALKLLVEEEGSQAARTLLDGPALRAPELIHVEVASALWRMARTGRLSAGDAADAVALFQRRPLRRRTGDAALAPRPCGWRGWSIIRSMIVSIWRGRWRPQRPWSPPTGASWRLPRAMRPARRS